MDRAIPGFPPFDRGSFFRLSASPETFLESSNWFVIKHRHCRCSSLRSFVFHLNLDRFGLDERMYHRHWMRACARVFASKGVHSQGLGNGEKARRPNE